MNPPQPRPLQPGEVVDGKYRIDGVLGQGAMGCVYEATHELLGDQVAIKCLTSSSPQAAQRFLREARVVRAIRSPHAVKVLDLGLLADGNPYLVMERLRGNDLEAHLRACGSLPVDQAADFVIQACDALAEAHAQGIVHRDLKPGNLFLTQGPDGLPLIKVLDFGIAKVLTSEGARQEQIRTAGPMGTPLYMSPEQIQGQSIDPRSDVWSLGVLLFQMLTEQFPFEAGSLEGLAVRICTAPPLAVESLRADLPAPLSRLIGACLAREPDLRPASVAEVASALRPFAPAAAHLVERIQRIAHSPPAAPAPRASLASAPELTPSSATLPESSTVSPSPSVAPASTLSAPAPPKPPPEPAPARGRPLAVASVVAIGLALAALLRPTSPPAPTVSLSSTPPPPASPPAALTQPPPSAQPSAALPAASTEPVAQASASAPAAGAASPKPTRAPSSRPAASSPPDPKQAAIRDRK